jgi:hypothetical protein
MSNSFEESAKMSVAWDRAILDILIENGMISYEEFWDKRFVKAMANVDQEWEEAANRRNNEKACKNDTKQI